MTSNRTFWTAVAGAALVFLGLAFLGSPVLSTFAAAMTWGVLLLVGGVVQGLHALASPGPDRAWGVFAGALAAIAGVLLLADPVNAVVGLTLAVAIYLVAVGAARLFAGFALPRPFKGWLLASGVTSLVLGLLVATQWPVSSLYTLGIFLGIDTIATGAARIAAAIMASGAAAAPPMRPRVH